jgi:hypothetical protein
MVVGFSKENIKKRNFIPKIWGSINEVILSADPSGKDWEVQNGVKLMRQECLDLGHLTPHDEYRVKRHTIRKKAKRIYKKGDRLHFAMGVRSPDYYQFFPTVIARKVQRIIIRYEERGDLMIIIDDMKVNLQFEKIRLAWNDGFENYSDFKEYFITACLAEPNHEFIGYLIWWGKGEEYS